ncbi:MAG: hypothetical protein K8W52_46480 [Deltaproteobacteria bacterium]|nr:hypothetical protein [Deltaproteobacteria bacterium]
MTDAKTTGTRETRIAAHLLTVMVGVIMLTGAAGSLTTDAPRVLTVAFLAFGAAGLVLPHYSWRGSRPAWAFAVALDGVVTPCLLFGSPKIAKVFEINLGVAGLPTVVAAVAFALMLSLSADYER